MMQSSIFDLPIVEEITREKHYGRVRRDLGD
jgi:hypothetical protein